MSHYVGSDVSRSTHVFEDLIALDTMPGLHFSFLRCTKSSYRNKSKDSRRYLRSSLVTMFPLSPPTETFITTAPWIFKVSTNIDLPVSDVWNILNDDGAWSAWLPELTKIEWKDEIHRERNSERTITFSDPLFKTLLCGPVKLHEVFDDWERNKTLGSYIKGVNRPNFLTYKCFQEKFVLEAINERQCKLTRILALEPGFVTRYVLGCIIYPHIKNHITKQCPDRFMKAVADGKLPRNTNGN